MSITPHNKSLSLSRFFTTNRISLPLGSLTDFAFRIRSTSCWACINVRCVNGSKALGLTKGCNPNKPVDVEKSAEKAADPGVSKCSLSN